MNVKTYYNILIHTVNASITLLTGEAIVRPLENRPEFSLSDMEIKPNTTSEGLA